MFVQKSQKKEGGKTWKNLEIVENAKKGDFRDETLDKKIEFRDASRQWRGSLTKEDVTRRCVTNNDHSSREARFLRSVARSVKSGGDRLLGMLSP